MKKIVLDLLDFFKYQVENDKCTTEELRNICDVAADKLEVSATIDDLAKHYNQSRSNVSNVLSRRAIPDKYKPKRRIYYNFAFFQRIVPASWRRTEH